MIIPPFSPFGERLVPQSIPDVGTELVLHHVDELVDEMHMAEYSVESHVRPVPQEDVCELVIFDVERATVQIRNKHRFYNFLRILLFIYAYMNQEKLAQIIQKTVIITTKIFTKEGKTNYNHRSHERNHTRNIVIF